MRNSTRHWTMIIAGMCAAAMSACSTAGVATSETGDGALAEVDPFKVVRLPSPFDDIFVREEYLPKYIPTVGAVEDWELRRLSVISISDRQILLNRVYGPSGYSSHADRFREYEWKDVTGDGKPEFLLRDEDESMRHMRGTLHIYQVRPQKPDPLADVTAHTKMVKVFEEAGYHETWQTYPTTTHMVGEFSFEPDADGNCRMVWSPLKGNRYTRDITVWTWDSTKNSFVAAKSAILSLIEKLNDDHWQVRRSAVMALGDTAPMTDEQISALVKALKDEHAQVREAAARALRKIDHLTDDVVPALIEALNDRETQVRQAAAWTLGDIRPVTEDVVPALIDAMGHDEHVRNAAVKSLGRIGRVAVPPLIKALGHKDRDVRTTAAEALGEVGPDAGKAAPDLLRALEDEDWMVRSRAARALGKIGPVTDDVVPALLVALRDRVNLVRRLAAGALGHIGPVTDQVIPALIEALKHDDDMMVRHAAAWALGAMGPAARDAVPALREALKDADREVRGEAARALQKIEQPDTEVP